MSEYYGVLQSLVNPPRSRVTQQFMISYFNNRGHGIGCHIHVIGHVGRGYGRSLSCGRGSRGGCGGRSYGCNPYEFTSRYRIFMEEARVYPVYQ